MPPAIERQVLNKQHLAFMKTLSNRRLRFCPKLSNQARALFTVVPPTKASFIQNVKSECTENLWGSCEDQSYFKKSDVYKVRKNTEQGLVI